jgi:hypothetical protein
MVLVVEVCFYLIAILLLPFLRLRRIHPVALPLLMISIAGVSPLLWGNLGANFFYW